MKISVITPTIRKDGLEIVRKALKRQTFKDFNWYIGSKFDPGIAEATWVKDDFRDGFWTLNRIYNKLFATAMEGNLHLQGTESAKDGKDHLIVSLQDNIWIEPDGLEKFYTCQQEVNALISGIGNQYEEVNEKGKPIIQNWADPRKTNKYGSFYECNWNDCEFNWAAIPASLFTAVGGFDEELDFLGYGGDQLQLCDRLNDYGAKFYIDQTNESFTLRHSRDDFGGQSNWDANHVLFNGRYAKRKQELKNMGEWPTITTQKPRQSRTTTEK